MPTAPCGWPVNCKTMFIRQKLGMTSEVCHLPFLLLCFSFPPIAVMLFCVYFILFWARTLYRLSLIVKFGGSPFQSWFLRVFKAVDSHTKDAIKNNYLSSNTPLYVFILKAGSLTILDRGIEGSGSRSPSPPLTAHLSQAPVPPRDEAILFLSQEPMSSPTRELHSSHTLCPLPSLPLRSSLFCLMSPTLKRKCS